MAKQSKRFIEAKKKVDTTKMYKLEEVVKLVKETATAKFDETIELHLCTSIDPRKADQQIRQPISLPHGTGKNVRILVFAQGENADIAKAAGADYVGAADYAEKIQKENWFDFDVAIATPDMMRVIGKLGRVLGPRGLMPSPKSGTVTNDVAEAVKAFQGGRIEARNDKTGNIHLVVGKKSFKDEMLKENLEAAVKQIMALKPASLKGKLFKKVSVASAMGPGVRLDANDIVSE
ncbi:MAG TPA: 50S ribosomal protein L1 [Thermotogota bacterium]|nr:50S ribosomal protein L1 [Thermotogota bacterium]HPJ88255.1 50S ribosomal protein L1 [Thermotogota bacterium]HPR96731.1 50S ribosomal protein L1 [Thermotogota bacterium]